MSDKDRIAALERDNAELKNDLAELKAKVDPPKPKPFKPEPYQQYDPTAGMCMPPSATQAMVAAEPRGFMAGVVRDNRNAPTSPTGMIPASQSGGGVREKSSTPGYVDPRPLGPQPGIDLIDRGVNAALPHGPEWGKKK